MFSDLLDLISHVYSCLKVIPSLYVVSIGPRNACVFRSLDTIG